jgi:transcription elongation factor Elf1
MAITTMASTVTVTVVCTDRGQHPSRRIARVRRDGLVIGRTGFQVDPRSGGTTLRCKTCGRHVELAREKWLRVVDALSRHGVSEIDLSRIPAV